MPSVSSMRTVHPHVRGDSGQRRRQLIPNRRFTPTCVGTALAIHREGQIAPVHPHVRGDSDISHPRHAHRLGSPPRAWGQLLRPGSRRVHQRFTPTCVGTACAFRLADQRHGWFTPTCVGTAWTAPIGLPGLPGSPPRAWGQRPSGCSGETSRRFTPTCVGTAFASWTAPSESAVHPHVRGDSDELKRHLLYVSRFTPTCVGTARPPGCAGRSPPGSPPRAWGQRDRGVEGGETTRFTPTCVGTALHTCRGSDRPRFTPTCVGTAIA